MSLKEFTKEIFTRYGFTEDDINVYLGYLRVPRATISEVWMHISEDNEEMDLARVTEITNMLEEKGFVKKVGGLIDRYIPLEPYFELFTTQSEGFRGELADIKDKCLGDQSKQFERLEGIQDKSTNEVDNAVDAQIQAFFEDSDAKNLAKKERIENARTRFTDTSKTLEQNLHSTIEDDYSRLTQDVNKNDKDSDDVWDANSNKFTADNEALNKELTDITTAQINSSNEQESKIHTIMDTLFSDLNSISDSFVSDNESGINTAKETLNKIIADLLEDFSKRVNDLEIELKKDLDGHVDRHKNVANELKPKMEQILEKYLERMDKVIIELKQRISNLLNEHLSHVKITTDNLQNDLKARVDNRHQILIDQVNSFKNAAITMLRNYLDSTNRFGDFSEDMAKQGLFFTGAKKKKYKARWAQVENDVASISRTFEDDWNYSCNTYISDTQVTTSELKGEIENVMINETNILASESGDLDNKAQETINAQLETLASDMAGEIDGTLQGGIKDCDDTSIKLKDSLENSLQQHHAQYGNAINRHTEESLRHYTELDANIKRKNENWVKDIENQFNGGKRDASTEIQNQNNNINDFLEKSKNKNITHSNTFATDVVNIKTNQRQIYDELLRKTREDFNKSKANTSEKIDAEIQLWNQESADMNQNLANMLEDHKVKYKENAKTLQNSLNNTTKENIQSVKDSVADFTLSLMNSIDDATETAETNEGSLTDIHEAAKNIPDIAKITTWHTIGRAALINAIKDAIYRVKSSIIIVTPVVIPEILSICSQHAYQKKAARFMLTANWDMSQYGSIIQKMKELGNVKFRNLTTQTEFYACTRDAEETILCPSTKDESQMVAVISNQEEYARLYSSVIGPMFLSNSRPIQ